MSTPRPRALLVHESMFGNTARVAEAVARGLERGGYDVSLVDVALARQDPSRRTWWSSERLPRGSP